MTDYQQREKLVRPGVEASFFAWVLLLGLPALLLFLIYSKQAG